MEIKKARIKVRINIGRQGSVRGQTIKAQTFGFDVKLEVESDAEPAQVAAVLRNAENGCYAAQAILNPTPIHHSLVVNGQEFSLADFPPPELN